MTLATSLSHWQAHTNVFPESPSATIIAHYPSAWPFLSVLFQSWGIHPSDKIAPSYPWNPSKLHPRTPYVKNISWAGILGTGLEIFVIDWRKASTCIHSLFPMCENLWQETSLMREQTLRGQFFASYWGRLWTRKGGAVPYFNICLFKLCPINFSHVDFDKSIYQYTYLKGK